MIEKLIVKKLEAEINRIILRRGLPAHDHILVGDYVVDAVKLWNPIKSVLS